MQLRIKEYPLVVTHPSSWSFDELKRRVQGEFASGEFTLEDVRILGETDEASDIEWNEQGQRCLSLIDLR